ncbi:MAG: tetratricopeptide repeat protein [Myxococcales bacterium]|nr:tetratricopeptide repeat protein [Myxococcales bacterium]
MGRLLQAQGAEAPEVQAEFLRALESDSSHREALGALEGMARAANLPSDLVQLLEMRASVATEAAEQVPLLREIADLYRGPLGNAAAGLPALEKLTALVPDDLEVREAYGQVLISVGRVEEGEGLLESLIEGLMQKRQMKAVARLRGTLGLAAEARGDVAKALAHLEAAQQLDASSPRVAVALGRLAESAGDLQKAFKYYRNLLLLSFDEGAAGITKPEVYLALARLHLAEGETSKARGMVDRGLGVAPNHPDLKQLSEALKRAS